METDTTPAEKIENLLMKLIKTWKRIQTNMSILDMGRNTGKTAEKEKMDEKNQGK